MAMALSIEAPGTPNGQRYSALDRRLAEQVTGMIAALQARGDVCAEVDAAAIGQLVFNNLNMMFIEFVKDDDMTLAELCDAVARQTRPLARLVAARTTT